MKNLILATLLSTQFLWADFTIMGTAKISQTSKLVNPNIQLTVKTDTDTFKAILYNGQGFRHTIKGNLQWIDFSPTMEDKEGDTTHKGMDTNFASMYKSLNLSASQLGSYKHEDFENTYEMHIKLEPSIGEKEEKLISLSDTPNSEYYFYYFPTIKGITDNRGMVQINNIPLNLYENSYLNIIIVKTASGLKRKVLKYKGSLLTSGGDQ
jgi:hypothetical protein